MDLLSHPSPLKNPLVSNPLPDNFRSLPDWLKEAYHKDQSVNRIVKDWRMSNKPLTTLWEKLAVRMYELKNFWEATTVQYAQKYGPL